MFKSYILEEGSTEEQINFMIIDLVHHQGPYEQSEDEYRAEFQDGKITARCYAKRESYDNSWEQTHDLCIEGYGWVAEFYASGQIDSYTWVRKFDADPRWKQEIGEMYRKYYPNISSQLDLF